MKTRTLCCATLIALRRVRDTRAVLGQDRSRRQAAPSLAAEATMRVQSMRSPASTQARLKGSSARAAWFLDSVRDIMRASVNGEISIGAAARRLSAARNRR
jgi:hypothetical protein